MAISRPHKSRRIARIQVFAISTLSVAGIINYIDRGSLAIANTTIRADLGISATQMGILLSIFSLAYAIFQLPMGILLDRFGERLVLGAGMFLWSVTQAATGMVSGFTSFFAARVGLAVGESPFVISAVKTVNDWFDVRDRATPMGIVNSATTMGQAIAPPILTVTMMAFGWRGMFMLIGIPGLILSVVWYVFYRDRRAVSLSDHEMEYLDTSGQKSDLRNDRTRISSAQWLGLFRMRTMWGMMLGFGGINYTVWLYMSWMPNYFEAEHHVSIAATGMIAVIPFAFGTVGMLISGIIADFWVRRGSAPIKTHRTLLVTGLTCSAICTLLVPYIPGAMGAAFGIGLALFFTYLAGNSGWGLVQSIAPAEIVASVGAIQNFGSFICASFAPIITGFLLDRTHSFHLTLVICAMVSFLGALSYLLIVKDPIVIGEKKQLEGVS
ncbi:MFS transporter [Acidicapsa ligni]|uniref:MFS transporter n=1 Tax=Acidicapsa ligni TaxID=542300 RepID=UPI0021E0E187|nr:MFS transporter [Acidicapsa ligni]